MSYQLRFQQIFPQLSESRGKTIDDISIKKYSSGEQLIRREKHRVMKELLIRYPDKIRCVHNSGPIPSMWFSIPDAGIRQFDKEGVHDFLKTIHPIFPDSGDIELDSEAIEAFEDSTERQLTKRWLEVFEHYFIQENPEMNPVSIRGLAGIVQGFEDLYLAFKEILERLRLEEGEYNGKNNSNQKAHH